MALAGGRFRFEGYSLDAARRQLSFAGRDIELRPKSFDVLRYLLERPGQTISKRAFFEAVWPDVAVTDASLVRCVSDIRQALGDRNQRMLKTVPGRGYVFAVPVTLEGAAAPALESGERVQFDRPSIAVRPFTDLSGDPGEAFLSAGITEDITGALCRLRELRVVACHAMPPDASGNGVRELGCTLGVRYVVDGSVRRAGERLRVTAQLIDAETGAHLWAERYERAIGDLFALQDEITASIAGCLGPEILSAEYVRASRKPPHSLDAWECVIRALFHSSQQSDGETRIALELLNQSLQHDPDYARALGMKAWILVFRAFQGWEDMGDVLQRVKPLIAHALAVDNHELWPYLAQGMVGFAIRDNGLSMSALERAVAISPNSVNAHGLLSVAHSFGGRFEAALASLGRAMQLSPRDTYLSDFELYQAFVYFQGARYDNGLAYARLAHQFRPGHVYPLVMAAACAGHLQHPLAGDLVRSLVAIVPNISSAWLEETSPYVLPEDRQRLGEGLRRAGLR